MINRVLQIALLLIISGSAYAKKGDIKFSIDRDSIYIGDRITAKIELDNIEGIDSISFPIYDGNNLSEGIELVEFSQVDTIVVDEVSKLSKEYYFTSFDPGVATIPTNWIVVNGDSIKFDSISVVVVDIEVDPKKGAAAIQPPYEAPVTLKEAMPWILGVILSIAFILLIGYFAIRWNKHRSLFIKPEAPKEPAHIIALRELDKIKEEQIWEDGNEKLYYGELTAIVKNYLDDRYGIDAPESTTDEIIALLKEVKELDEIQIKDRVVEMLSFADLVKFAKFNASSDECSESLQLVYRFIEKTKMIETVDIEDIEQPDSNEESNKKEEDRDE